MKDVTLFVLENCPHCKNALKMMDEICSEHPEYKDVHITKIDEGKDPETANKYDYYYVPTYYVDGEKLHEGVPTKEAILKVYEAATA